MHQIGANSYDRYGELMHKCINPNVSPADDFINYARGNFSDDYFDRKKGDYLPVMNENSFDNVIINETITNPSLVKARNYRKSHVKEFRNLLRNKKINELCGTVPAFDEHWQDGKFDWVKMTGLLSGMHFRLTFSFRYEDKDAQRHYTLSIIGPDEGPLPEHGRESLEELHISEESISEILNDFTRISQKFDEITPKVTNIDTIQMNYAEVKRQNFDYIKFLEFAVGHQIDENAVFNFNSLDTGYFEKFVNMFEDTGTRAIANYITYQYAQQLINDYYSSAVTNYYFSPAVRSAGFWAFLNSDVLRRRSAVKEEFKSSVEKLRKHFKKDISSKLSSCELNDEEVLSFAQSEYNLEEVDRDYEDLHIDVDDFIGNFFRIREKGKSPSLKRYIKLLDGSNPLHRSAGVLLDFAIQTNGRPMFFLFAGWEFQMWKDIIYECGFDDSSEHYKSIATQIRKQMQERELEVCVYSKEFWMKEHVSSILALQLAFKDYQNWQRNNPEETRTEQEFLKPYNLTCNQAFFIAFVQHSFAATGEMLNSVILSIINSFDFPRMFECATNSGSNPSNKVIISFNGI